MKSFLIRNTNAYKLAVCGGIIEFILAIFPLICMLLYLEFIHLIVGFPFIIAWIVFYISFLIAAILDIFNKNFDTNLSSVSIWKFIVELIAIFFFIFFHLLGFALFITASGIWQIIGTVSSILWALSFIVLITKVLIYSRN